MIDSKYTTLVFKTETVEEKELVRSLSQAESCKAWMLDHALLKLDLIEKAIDENDLDRAGKYFDSLDVTQYQHELDQINVMTTDELVSRINCGEEWKLDYERMAQQDLSQPNILPYVRSITTGTDQNFRIDLHDPWTFGVSEDGWSATIFAPHHLDMEYDDATLHIGGNLSRYQFKRFAELVVNKLNE